ncbi:MAG: molybdopterin-guanine dinucleotide biosynthesis protein B [Lachnospiraceae bacterium]|nr:molybdopterin-guanine dinucleotide biosynthesis protein B [Lachnospiraceae bacterium]
MPVIFAISGYKNSGKTTLTVKLVAMLTEMGYQVATIKHDGHDFEPDVPGTDSFRHRKAGACGCAVFSANRWMVIKDQPSDEAKKVDEQALIQMFPEADIILLEGFKHSSWPKYFCRFPEEIPDEKEALSMILRQLKPGKI